MFTNGGFSVGEPPVRPNQSAHPYTAGQLPNSLQANLKIGFRIRGQVRYASPFLAIQFGTTSPNAPAAGGMGGVRNCN
jgi:hypothetical protein